MQGCMAARGYKIRIGASYSYSDVILRLAKG
jgi:hypothetical protein